jgi:hypothetical protein
MTFVFLTWNIATCILYIVFATVFLELPCMSVRQHGMALHRVADGGTVCDMEGSCE